VDTKLEKQIASTLFHCIKCGKIWGEGVDIGSSGVCPQCFVLWAESKKECFGSENCLDLEKSLDCVYYKYCYSHYLEVIKNA